MTTPRTRSARALTATAEVLELRHLLSGDVTFTGLNRMAVVGVEFSGTVASFDIPATEAARPSYATIDWGDGSTSVAELRSTVFATMLWRGDDVPWGFGPQGHVVGRHTYRTGGDYTIKTTMVLRSEGLADRTIQTTSTIRAEAREVEAQPLPSLTTAARLAVENVYARFLANFPGEPSSWTATIDWGDGSAPVPARVTPATWIDRGPIALWLGLLGGDGATSHLEVVAAHAYPSAGTYTATITIDDGQGLATTATRTVEVLASPLVVQPREVALVPAPWYSAYPARLGLANVADFSLSLTDTADLSRYRATIDWGDGSPTTAGTLSRLDVSMPGGEPDGPARFVVTGSHAYAQAGPYSATITVTDDQGHTASTTVTVDEVLDLEPVPLNAVRNLARREVLARGRSSAIHEAAGDQGIAATIDWGDGSPVEAVEVVTTTGGWFSVLGRHVYTQPGTYSARVTVAGPQGATESVVTTVTVAGFVGVLNTAQIQVGESYGSGAPGVGLVGVLDAAASPADFTATIDWGDGSPAEAGTLVAIDGAIEPWSTYWPVGSTMMVVKGNHAYSRAGVYSLMITVTRASGETHVFGNLISIVPEAVVRPILVTSPALPGPQVAPGDNTPDSTPAPETDATPQVAIPRRRGRKQGKGPHARRWPEVTRFGHPDKPLRGKARVRALAQMAMVQTRRR